MTTKGEKHQPALERRIRSFYHLLNRRDFERCFQMLDPRVRNRPTSVTLFQYGNAMRQFAERFGPLQLLETHVALHLNEPNKLYEGRDFALGKTIVLDKDGERQVFSERWVRDGRAWYTRSTGFVVPETRAAASANVQQQAMGAALPASKRPREVRMRAGGGRRLSQGK
jgi:hypothetical protein